MNDTEKIQEIIAIVSDVDYDTSDADQLSEVINQIYKVCKN